jgi:glycosyltransferase involved in cell wall biosynthesis
VQPNSPEILAQEIISLLDNRNHMQNIAMEGLKRFNELYHWKKAGKYWTDVFKELV